MKKYFKLILLLFLSTTLTACGGNDMKDDIINPPDVNEDDDIKEEDNPPVIPPVVEDVITVKGAPTTLEYGHLYDDSSIEIEVNSNGAITTFKREDIDVDFSRLDEWKLGKQTVEVYDIEGEYEHQYIDVEVVPATHLKMLLIGNSYTEDTMQNIPELLKNIEGLDLEISYLFIGGKSLNDHYQYLVNDSASYSFRTYTSETGKWTIVENYKMKDAFTKEWDLISLQQQSMDSSKPNSFSNLDNFVHKIEECFAANEIKCPRFVWHFTWSYPVFSTNYDFMHVYEGDPIKMFEGNLNVLHNVILQKPYFVNYCPVGTAVQNLRSSYLNDGDVYRDELHMSMQLGRFLASCTFIGNYLGQDSIDYLSKQYIFSNKELMLIAEAVNNALSNKDEVTPSKYKFPPSDNLIELKNNAIEYIYSLIKKDSDRTYSEDFVKKTKELVKQDILSIQNADSEERINLLIDSVKAKIEQYQNASKAEEIQLAKDFFETRQSVTDEENFSIDENGRIIQSDTSKWTRIRFGEQQNNNFTVFEFDLTPVYANEQYSSLTLRFREWDTSTNLSVKLMANSFLFKRNYWSKESGASVEDSTYHSEFEYKKVSQNQTRHFKIMCAGWTKTFMIDDDVLVNVSMQTDCAGYFSIESWQTKYILENPRLTKFDNQSALVEKYPEVFNKKNVG